MWKCLVRSLTQCLHLLMGVSKWNTPMGFNCRWCDSVCFPLLDDNFVLASLLQQPVSQFDNAAQFKWSHILFRCRPWKPPFDSLNADLHLFVPCVSGGGSGSKERSRTRTDESRKTPNVEVLTFSPERRWVSWVTHQQRRWINKGTGQRDYWDF